MRLAVLRLLHRALGIAAIGVAGLSAESASALSPYLEVPERSEVEKTPAYRYAQMTDDEAYAELDRRGILYQREKVSGVRAPIRLTGRLHGVLIRSVLPPAERATSIFEICDARLALALDDFGAILEKHDVEEVVHYTMYRPNVPKPGSPQARKKLVQAKGMFGAKGGKGWGKSAKRKPGEVAPLRPRPEP